MLSDRYRLRPYEDRDLDGESRIQRQIRPDHPMTAPEFRAWDRVLRAPGRFVERLSVEERATGALAGTGAVHHAPWAYDPDWYWVAVSVDPAHGHRGVGRRLAGELERIAVGRGARGLWCSSRAEDPRALRFLAAAGFVERRRTWISRLDLAAPGADPPSAPVGGLGAFRFTTLAEEGAERADVLARVYDLYAESGRDVPTMGPAPAFTYEQFLALTVQRPVVLRDGLFLAAVGDRYVAMTSLARMESQPDTLNVDFTGTRREYRGRGLALELKRRARAFARASGYRYLRAGNDSLNAPIWAINQRLGFRRASEMVHAEKALVARGGASS